MIFDTSPILGPQLMITLLFCVRDS